ncbi:MAG: hypothetical protein M9964_04855 [Solirubrobacterales bacterium]|nr:hypothetical protein [Thermoleophilales bacterium]MCO5326372.1 hypothetical protein [Solirubrobacterales bacterium]
MGLVLLLALTATAVIGLLTGAGPGGERSLASQIAFKQRCAVRFPDPCWQDPLTEAYGRGLAGAIRALAPAPAAVAGLAPVDYRRCRQVSCAAWAGPHLTASNRRTTLFTSVREAGAEIAIDYWSYRPSLGWERATQRVGRSELPGYASVPLLDSADPVLVPLETTLGRDDARFASGEEPPWRGQVESRWGR